MKQERRKADKCPHESGLIAAAVAACSDHGDALSRIVGDHEEMITTGLDEIKDLRRQLDDLPCRRREKSQLVVPEVAGEGSKTETQ